MNSSQNYSVVFTRKVRKGLAKIPQNILDKFFFLAEQLAEHGPVAANWQNYSSSAITNITAISGVHG